MQPRTQRQNYYSYNTKHRTNTLSFQLTRFSSIIVSGGELSTGHEEIVDILLERASPEEVMRMVDTQNKLWRNGMNLSSWGRSVGVPKSICIVQ